MSSKRKRRLTERQERKRIEGLRILARIIARHHLAHPHQYPNGAAGDGDGSRRQQLHDHGRGDDPEGGRGVKRRQPSSRVKLNPHAVWDLLNRRNMTQERAGAAARHLVELPLPAHVGKAPPLGGLPASG